MEDSIKTGAHHGAKGVFCGYRGILLLAITSCLKSGFVIRLGMVAVGLHFLGQAEGRTRLGLLAALLFIGWAEMVSAATPIASLPFTCSTANETYVVQSDLSIAAGAEALHRWDRPRFHPNTGRSSAERRVSRTHLEHADGGQDAICTGLSLRGRGGFWHCAD